MKCLSHPVLSPLPVHADNSSFLLSPHFAHGSGAGGCQSNPRQYIMTITDELLDEIGRSRNKSRRRESPTDALWVRGSGCDGGLGGKMFGPSEEVIRAQAAEAIGLKDIPASNDEYIILIKRQEVQGMSVDVERLTEQAKWKRTQSLSVKRRVKTRTGTKIMLSSSFPGLTRIHTNPRFTSERPVTGCTGRLTCGPPLPRTRCQ